MNVSDEYVVRLVNSHVFFEFINVATNLSAFCEVNFIAAQNKRKASLTLSMRRPQNSVAYDEN